MTARRADQKGSGSQLKGWDRKLTHKRHEQHMGGKVITGHAEQYWKKAEVLTSNFPIGFQGRLPAHNDSARLPFSSNDCQILGSRGRGCQMKQRQGLVIGCERKQIFMGLLIMVLPLGIYHAVYHAYFAICNLFRVLELNKRTHKNTEVKCFLVEVKLLREEWL